MSRSLIVVMALCALTALNFLQFPGHTYLQADSQIYVPILERLWDPTVFANDPVAQRPHVGFTLYDEVTLALRKASGLPLRETLEAQQIVFRALGILGFYLIASSVGLSTAASLLVTAILSLGATIGGPSVLSFEYEPTPRAFALPLVFLAIGLVAHSRLMAGAIAASAAVLLHPPTAYPFWTVYAIVAVLPSTDRRRKLLGFLPLAAAGVLLWITSEPQRSGAQVMTFFTRIDPAQEALQRMRASYNWISVWWRDWLPHYAVLYALTLLAVARLGRSLAANLRPYAIGLPLIGILSAPASYLMLEKMKLALLPQFQPMRALLFVTVMAVLSASIAACVAVSQKHYWEAAPWLILAYLIPVNTRVTDLPSLNRVAVVAGLAALALIALRSGRTLLIAAAALAPFFAIPICGKVVNYPVLHTLELESLSSWARTSTPKAAVFAFPDAGKDLAPGVFRAESLRAVYVDWKAGGQVNYFKDFGDVWWPRWQDVMLKPLSVPHLADLGIDYIVVKPEHRLPRAGPAFQNGQYVVYAIERR